MNCLAVEKNYRAINALKFRVPQIMTCPALIACREQEDA